MAAGIAWAPPPSCHPARLLTAEDRWALIEPRPEFYSRRFAALCNAAGVPVIRLHATRHTAATLLLSKGMPMVDVAALLGHTVDVLLDRYGRSTPGGVQAVAEVFAQAVSE
jgi:integrase